MSNITRKVSRKVSGTKRRKTNLQTSDKTGDKTNPQTGDKTNNKSNPQTGEKSNDKSNPQTGEKSNDKSNPQTSDKSNPQTSDKSNPQTGDKSSDKTNQKTSPQTKPQTRPQTNITTYSDMFSGMFNNIGKKYNNKYNYYGDICAQIKETLKKDIDELTVVNYLYDYNSLLNRLKSFQAFVQRGLSNSFQDNIQVDILNNLSKQCDTEIAVCETIMSQIENISLTDIFKDYIPIFNEMNNEMSNEMNNEVEIPFIQNYVDIIEKIKIKKKCKQTLVSKCMDIIKLQAIRIKEILSDQDNILNTLERLDKNKTMKSMINYFNILSPLYVEKILKNIDHVNSLLLESYLVDNLNKIYERLLRSFIEEIDPNSYVENLGMKKDRLYLYNDGSYEYNKVCQSARGSICYYMKPLYKTDDPVKEVKKYVKDVKIKKLSINGDNKTVYYL